MADQLTSAETFKAICTNLGLLQYDSDGKAFGLYVTEFEKT